MLYANGHRPLKGDRVLCVLPSPMGTTYPGNVGHIYTTRKAEQEQGISVLGVPAMGADQKRFKLITRAWQKNTGQRPDLPAGTRIDIQYNDGTIICNVPADGHQRDKNSWIEELGTSNRQRSWAFGSWILHPAVASGIVKYRIRIADDDGSPCTYDDERIKEPSPKDEELKVLL